MFGRIWSSSGFALCFANVDDYEHKLKIISLYVKYDFIFNNSASIIYFVDHFKSLGMSVGPLCELFGNSEYFAQHGIAKVCSWLAGTKNATIVNNIIQSHECISSDDLDEVVSAVCTDQDKIFAIMMNIKMFTAEMIRTFGRKDYKKIVIKAYFDNYVDDSRLKYSSIKNMYDGLACVLKMCNTQSSNNELKLDLSSITNEFKYVGRLMPDGNFSPRLEKTKIITIDKMKALSMSSRKINNVRDSIIINSNNPSCVLCNAKRPALHLYNCFHHNFCRKCIKELVKLKCPICNIAI
jgi:hypothetical protein